MISQSQPDSTDGVTPQIGHQARIVVGGLSTVKRTLSLIEEQAKQLEALDLVDAAEVERLHDLAAQATDLITHYREGRFLDRLKILVNRGRDDVHD